MPSEDRPATRTLVRWNDDLDKSILLFINYACGEAGIKIPFKRVAQLMGERFSEGAIVQHMAKIRLKMLEERKKNPELLVPAAVKRGSITKPASVMAYTGNKKRKANEVTGTTKTVNTGSSAKAKSRNLKHESDEDGDDDDSEWMVESKTKKAKKPKRITIKKDPGTATNLSRSMKEEPEDGSDHSVSAIVSPKRLTRGVKTNYHETAGGLSDYDDSGPEDEMVYLEADEAEPAPKPPVPKFSISSKIASPKAAVIPIALTTPTQIAQTPLVGNDSGAAFMPSIGSNYTGVGTINECNSMLFAPLDFVDPFGFGGFGDLTHSTTASDYDVSMYTGPFASRYSSMNQSFNIPDASLWTPSVADSLPASRNNSNASSISNPNQVQTPPAEVGTVSRRDTDHLSTKMMWDDAIFAEQLNFDGLMEDEHREH